MPVVKEMGEQALPASIFEGLFCARILGVVLAELSGYTVALLWLHSSTK